MIGRLLVFLRDHLNSHLKIRASLEGAPVAEEKVALVDGDRMDPLVFKAGLVTVLLVNVEEERTLRRADRYARTNQDGSSQKVQPEIRLNLYVLFVARFKQYEQSWSHLSQIVQYFQANRVLNAENAPGLPESIEKLDIELVTLEFSQLNEIWNVLRTTHHPSVLYRVKLIVFADDGAMKVPEIADRTMETHQ